LGPFLDRVRLLLRAAPVLGADETPAWVDGGWKYVHVACTDRLPLFHAGRRTKDDIDAGGVLAGFTAVLVRDDHVGYDHIDAATHAECGAHLLHDAGSAGELSTLSVFREALYDCPTRRADALFELCDAVLCAEGPVCSLVGLSLAAEHRRGHGALYDAVNAGAGTGGSAAPAVGRFAAAPRQ
jgi:hypothetical protein